MKLYRCKFLYAFLSSLGGDQRVLMRYFLSLCFRVKGRGKALRLGAELLWRLKQLCLGLTTFWKKIERQSKNVACATTVGQHHWAKWGTSDSITLGHQPRELCPLQETIAEKTKSQEITTQPRNLRQRSRVVDVNLIHGFLHLRHLNSSQIGPVSEGPPRWAIANCCFAHLSCHCTVHVRNHPPLQPPPPCPINPCSGPASKQIKCTLSGPRP